MGNGDDGFIPFYQEAYGRVIGLAAALTGDLAKARLITQEAFARTLAAWPKAGSGQPERWVRRIMVTLASDATARGGRGRAGGTVPEALAGSTLGDALLRLSVAHRQVLVLSFAGLPADEIARDCGVSVVTVRTRLAAARRRLDRELGRTPDPAEFAEWVRPASDSPAPGIDALRQRVRQRKVRVVAGVTAGVAAVAAVAVGVTLSLPAGRPGPAVRAGTSGRAVQPRAIQLDWEVAGWAPAGAPVGSVAAARYYIQVPSDGPAQTPTSGRPIEVRDSLTGAIVSRIVPPGGGAFVSAAAAADDATFFVEQQTAEQESRIFELQLGPGGHPGPLILLGRLTGWPGQIAVSPDGRELAVSHVPQTQSATTVVSIDVISLAARTLRTWTGTGFGSGFSWADDDRTLGFYWYSNATSGAGPLAAATGFRLLDTSAPGGDLEHGSRLVVPDKLSPDGSQVPEMAGSTLTPDGSKVIVTMDTGFSQGSNGPIPVTGQIYEYSVQTGKVLQALTPPVTVSAQGQGLACQTLWTSPSAYDLVLYCGPSGGSAHSHVTVVDGRISLSAALHPPTSYVFAW